MSILAHTEKRTGPRKRLIIGAGVIGLSTAWNLLKDGHNDVTVLDQPDSLAPSRDISKFFRVDYTDPERMKVVMKSKELWEKDDLFKPFLHRTGRIVAYPPTQVDTLTEIDRARSELSLPARKHESARLLEDVFESTPLPQQLEVVHNEDDGVVDWDRLMKSMKQECINMGGKFQDGRVLHLASGEGGMIDAVVTSGDSIDTTQTDIILAAGPWIMQLLEASSIQQPPLSRAPIATGIFAFHLEMTTQQWVKYHDLPRFCEIGVCEFVCHPIDIGAGKVTWTATAFRNPSGNGALSEPIDVAKTDLAIRVMLDARDWIRTRIPGLKGARIKSIWSYWDGVTGNQKPIIVQHPGHPNLTIAGGGSYTHAKDLPYIGRVVTEVLHGTETHNQFGWDENLAGKHLNNQPSLHSDLLFGDLDLEAKRDQRVKDWRRECSEWIV